MKRHSVSEWIFMAALFIAIAGTMFLALAPKVNLP
jgi:hypothetical protein